MPSYPITAPDGTRYIVNAPEGATAEDALRYAKAQLFKQQEAENVVPEAEIPEVPETPEYKRDEYLKRVEAPIEDWAKNVPIERGFLGNLTTAVKRTGVGTGSTFTDLIPAMYDAFTGDEEAAKKQLEEAKAKQEEAARQYPAQFDKVEDVPFSQILPYIGEKMGEGVTSTLPTLALGTAAALTAPASVPAAMFLGAFAMNAPNELQNLYEKTGQITAPAAAISGALQSSLDILPELRFVGKLAGPLKAAITKSLLEKSGMAPGLVKTVLKETGMAVAGEGLTGGAQEAISILAEEIVGKNSKVWGSEEFSRILNSAIGEAAGGLAFGPVAGVAQYGRVSAEKSRLDEEARVKQEAQDKADRLVALEGTADQPGLIAKQQQKVDSLQAAMDSTSSKRDQFAFQKEKEELANLQKELQRSRMTPEELEAADEAEQAAKVAAKKGTTAPEQIKTIEEAFKHLGVQPKEAAIIIDALNKKGGNYKVNFKSDLSGQAAQDFLDIIRNYPPHSEEQAGKMDEFIWFHPELSDEAITTAKNKAEEEKFKGLKRGKSTKEFVDGLLANKDLNDPETYKMLMDVSGRGNTEVTKEIDRRIAATPELLAQRKAAEPSEAPLATATPTAPEEAPPAEEQAAEEPVEPTEAEKEKLRFESYNPFIFKRILKNVADVSDKNLSPEEIYSRFMDFKRRIEAANPKNMASLLKEIDTRLRERSPAKVRDHYLAQLKAEGDAAVAPNRELIRVADEATENESWFGNLGNLLDEENARRIAEDLRIDALNDPEFLELAKEEKQELKSIENRKKLALNYALYKQQNAERQAKIAEKEGHLEEAASQQAIADQARDAFDLLQTQSESLFKSEDERIERFRERLKNASINASETLQKVKDSQLDRRTRSDLYSKRAKIKKRLDELNESLGTFQNTLVSETKKIVSTLPTFEDLIVQNSAYRELYKKDPEATKESYQKTLEEFVRTSTTKTKVSIDRTREKIERNTKELDTTEKLLSGTVYPIYSYSKKTPQNVVSLFLTNAENFVNSTVESAKNIAQKPEELVAAAKEAFKPETFVAEKPAPAPKEEDVYEPFTTEDIAGYIKSTDNFKDLDDLYDVIIDAPEFSEEEKSALLGQLNERTIRRFVDNQLIVEPEELGFIKKVGAKNIYGRSVIRAYFPDVQALGRALVPPSKRLRLSEEIAVETGAAPEVTEPKITLEDLKNAVIDVEQIAKERVERPKILDLDSLSDEEYGKFQAAAKKADSHYEAIRLMFGMEKALKSLAADIASSSGKTGIVQSRINRLKEGNLSIEKLKGAKKNEILDIFGDAGTKNVEAESPDEIGQVDFYKLTHTPLTGKKYGLKFFESLTDAEKNFVIKTASKYHSMGILYDRKGSEYFDKMTKKEREAATIEALNQGWRDALEIDEILKQLESSSILSSDTDYGGQLKGALVTKALWYAQNFVGKLIDAYDRTYRPESPALVKISKQKQRVDNLRKSGAPSEEFKAARAELSRLNNELNNSRADIYADLKEAYHGFIKFVQKHSVTNSSIQYQAKRTMTAISEVISEHGLPKGVKSSSVQELKDTIKFAMRRPDVFDKVVKVFASPRESGLGIPDDVLGAVARDPNDPSKFEVYLFANNIPEGRGLAVFLHEIAGHVGMRKLVGEGNYNFLIKNIKKWAESSNNKIENIIARTVTAKIEALKANNEIADSEVDEESLAYFIEEAVASGLRPSELRGGPLKVFFDKIMAGINNLLNKLNLGVKKLSAQDIVDMAYGAAHLSLGEFGLTSEEFSPLNYYPNNRVDIADGVIAQDEESAEQSVQDQQEYAALLRIKKNIESGVSSNKTELLKDIIDRIAALKLPTAVRQKILAEVEGRKEGEAPARRRARPKTPKQIRLERIARAAKKVEDQNVAALQSKSEVEELTGKDIEDSALPSKVKSDFAEYEEVLSVTDSVAIPELEAEQYTKEADEYEEFSEEYEKEVEEKLDLIAEELAKDEPVAKARIIIAHFTGYLDGQDYVSTDAVPKWHKYVVNLYAGDGTGGTDVEDLSKQKIRIFYNKILETLEKSGLYERHLDDLQSMTEEEYDGGFKDKEADALGVLETLAGVLDSIHENRLQDIRDSLYEAVSKGPNSEKTKDEISKFSVDRRLDLLLFSRPTPPTVSPQIASNTPVVNALTFGRMKEKTASARPWDGRTIQNLKNGLSVLKPESTSKLFSLLSNREFASFVEKESKGLASAMRRVDDAYGIQVAKEAKDRQVIAKDLTRWTETYNKLTAVQKNVFEEVFHEASRLQVDVEDPANVGNTLAIKFNNLPPEAKKMFKDIYSGYSKFRDRYIDLIDKLTDGELSTSMKVTYDAMKKGLQIYAPLQRYGDYWLSYIDKELDHVPMAFRTPAEREAFAKDLLASGINKKDISMYKRVEDVNTETVPPTAGFTRIMQAMKAKGASQDLIDDVYRTYLSTLPSSSIRKQFQRRSAYKGYEKDALRVYADVATKMAHQLAHMEFVKEADLQEAEARKIAKQFPSDFNTMAYQSFAGRVNFLRSPARDDFASKAGRFSYTYYILNNVSSALMNTLALPTVVHGMLAGPYGHDKARKAIASAMKMVFKGGYDDNSSLRSFFTGRNLSDITFYGDKARRDKKFEAEYADLYNAAVNRTAIRRSTGQEIGARKSAGIEDYTGTRVRIEGSLNWVFQNSERFVREVSLLSAYHLALDAGATKKQAIQKALDFVEQVNGAATTGQGAPVFQGSVGRFVGIFKKYPAAMMHLQAKLIYQALKDADPKTRAIARKQFLTIMGMTYLFCGVRGMPLVGMGTMLASILQGLFGDDDDFDADFALLDAVGSTSYYGPVGQMLNTDFGRAGLTNMLYRSDPERFEKVGVVPYTLETLGGAPVSIALSMERAANQFSEGNYLKALQSASPSFVRNAIKSFEMLNNGLVNSRGEVLRETSAMDSFKQFFGLSSLDIRRTYELNTFMYRADKKLNKKYQSYFDRYNVALDSEDIDGAIDVLNETSKWNEKHPEFQITKEKLTESRRKHIKNLNDAVDGVRLSPSLRQEIMDKYGRYKPE